MRQRIHWLIGGAWVACGVPNIAFSGQADFATHYSDHDEDAQIEALPMVHVHGLRPNNDRPFGPVPQKTPSLTILRQLEGKSLDDWLKARCLVSKEGEARVVILQPVGDRVLTSVSLQAFKQWTFLPQMDGGDPVDGEASIRIHFRTQEQDKILI